MSNKRGRPLSNNKREHEYHLRLNNEEVVSKVLREALKNYNYEETHPETNREDINMPVDRPTEIVRKVSRKNVRWWGESQEEIEIELSSRRNRAWTVLDLSDHLALNDVCGFLGIDRSREGLTLGWEFRSFQTKTKVSFFTWAFCADGSVEITFHNLKDITNLYKTEEELA